MSTIGYYICLIELGAQKEKSGNLEGAAQAYSEAGLSCSSRSS